MDRNALADEHEFVRPDEKTKVPRSSSGVNNAFRYIPEDSCDSVISLEDGEEDDEDDDSQDAAKSANRSYQGPSPGRAAKPQEPSAVEELQALMLSVREASTCTKENQEKTQDGKTVCKVESSMEVDYQKEKSSVTVPNLEMVEEPEESYRARYESEGCRGPIRGVSENGFPTVRVNGYSGSVLMTVYLVTECGEPHLHSITGPGSTKTMCKEVNLEGNVSAIQTWIGPEQNMTAVWDSLSVRRIRNWDADKKLRERGDNPAAWKAKKKEARLMFQCNIPQTAERPGYILTCQSRPFMCTAPSGNPEIWWISESESPPLGGKEIAIIGKKFSTGFRVRFYGTDPVGSWECYAEVDKSKSHQGAIVLKVPQYKTLDIDKKIEVLVEVRVGPEKDKRCSESIAFTYKAETGTEVKKNEPCSYCNSVKNALSHLFGKDSKNPILEQANDSSLEPESKRPPAKIEDSLHQLQSVDLEAKQSENMGSTFKDVQMSDVSRKDQERKRKDLGKGRSYFPEAKNNSQNVSQVHANQIGQNVADSVLVHLLLQNQSAGGNLPLLHESLPAAMSSAVPLPSAFSSGTISIPSQATAPVASPQLIGSTQTKLHTGLSVLAGPQNVALLPDKGAKVPGHSVQACIFNNPPPTATYALGNVFTAPQILPSSMATHMIPTRSQINSVATQMNLNAANAFSGVKSQEYFVIPGVTLIDGPVMSSVKNDVAEGSVAAAAKLGGFNPQIGSSWSLSEKPQMSTTMIRPVTTIRPQPGSFSSNTGVAPVASSTVLLLSQRPVASATLNHPASVLFSASPTSVLQTQMRGARIQQQNEGSANANNTLVPGLQCSLPPATYSFSSTMSQSMFMQQSVLSEGLRPPGSSDVNNSSVTVNVLEPGCAIQSVASSNLLQALTSNSSEPLSQNTWSLSTNHPTANTSYSSPSSKMEQMRSSQVPAAIHTPANQQQQFSPLFSTATVQGIFASQPSQLQTTAPSYESLSMGHEGGFQNVVGFTSADSVVPNTNGQMTSGFGTSHAPANGPIIGEQIGEKENVLAHDLNRLSVVGSLAQPTAFHSEPREIPRSTTQFTAGFSGVSPSFNEPQPMSLTDDNLPEMMEDLIKHRPANDINKPVISSEQQQSQLVDSYLVSTLRSAEKQGDSANQFIEYSQEPMTSVNRYIVGEDAMFSGPDLAKSAGANVWTEEIQTSAAPQTSVESLASVSAIDTAIWNQQRGMVHSQPIGEGKGGNADMNGDGKPDFVSDYIDGEGAMRTSVYDNIGNDHYTDKSSQPRGHLNPILTAEMGRVPSSTQQQQGVSALPAASYGEVQNPSTVNLSAISSEQQAYFSNQDYNSMVDNLSVSQQFAMHGGASASVESKSELQTQVNAQSFNSQAPINVAQGLLVQNESEALPRCSDVMGSHVTPGSTVELEQAKLELMRDTHLLLSKGMLNQREAETIYASVQTNDSLLLEVYRTSRKDSESDARVVEILQHWVKQFV